MDIGTLTGSIEIEDQASHALDVLADKVKDFASEWDGIMGRLAVGAGAVVAAIGAVTAAVTALGVRGSEVNDVADTLDRFAGSAENATEIMNKMRDGTKGLVTDFDLMKNASKLLAADVKLSADEFGTLSQGARLLANQGLGSVKDMMGLVSQAMLTGQTRTLEMRIGKMDLKKAEEDYAKSLNTTRNDLTQAEKVEAHRVGVLELLRQKIAETGEQSLSFGDLITRSITSVQNFFNELGSAVAASPAVMQAMENIQASIADAFGGSQEELIQNIVIWIEKFATAAADAVEAASNLAQKAKDLYDWYQKLPEPIRDTAELLGKAALGIWAVNAAFTAIAGVSAGKLIWDFASALTQIGIAAPAAIAEVGLVASELTALEIVLGVMVGVAGAAVDALIALGAALVAPVVIAGVALAIANFVENLKELHEWTEKGGKSLDFFLKKFEELPQRRLGRALGILPELPPELREPIESKPTTPLTGRGAITKFQAPATAPVSPEDPEVAAARARQGRIAEQEAESQAKRIADLFKTYSEGSKNLDAVDAATKRLTASQMGNYDVLERVVPDILKLSEAGRTLTTSQQKMLDTYRAETVARNESMVTQLKEKGVTEQAIEAQQRAGLSMKLIAQSYGVTEGAIKQYLDQLKKQEEAQRGNAAFEQAFRDQQLKDAQRLQKQSEEVNKFVADMDKEYQEELTANYQTETQKRVQAITEEYNARMALAMLGKTPEQQQQIQQTGERNKQKAIQNIYDADDLEQFKLFDRLDKEATENIKALNRAAKTAALDGLASLFQSLGQIEGGLGEFMATMGGVIVGLKRANDWANTVADRLGDNVKTRFGALSVAFNSSMKDSERWAAGFESAVAIAQGAMAVMDATQSKRTAAGNAAAGAMAGAQAGSAFGPLGIAIGAAAGLVTGLIRGKPDWAKAADEVGRDFGTKISDALAKEIEESAKKDFGGSRQAASIFNLDKIIGEAGGVSAENVDTFTARLRDVFVMVQTGAFTTAQAVEVLDKNFAALLEGNTDKFGYWSDSIKEIINLNNQMGLGSKAVSDAVKQQASNLAGAFNSIMAGTKVARTQYADLKKHVDEATAAEKKLRDEYDKTSAANRAGVSAAQAALEKAQKHPGIDRQKSIDAVKAAQAGLTAAMGAQARTDEELRKAHDKTTEALKAQFAAAEAAKQELNDLGVIAVASFSAAYEASGDFYEALKLNQSGLKDLSQSFIDLGMNAEDPFLKMLLVQSQVLEQQPELIEGAQGLGSALVSMSNLNMLNAQSFEAVERTAAKTYQRIQAEVAKAGGSTADALLPMQKYLHEAERAAKDLNVALDPVTQQMIDQSKELGVWKDEGPTAQEQMLQSTKDLTTAIDHLTQAIGRIPGSIPDPFKNWQIPDPDAIPTGPDNSGAGGAGTGEGFAEGGEVGRTHRTPTAQDIIPAWLRKGEVVLTPNQASMIASAIPTPRAAAAPVATPVAQGPTSVTFGDVQFVTDKDTDAPALWEAFINELRMNPNTRGKLQVIVTGNREDTHY